MPHVVSADGTTISFDLLSSEGPALVMIGGGLDDGSENVPLGQWLSDTFTVVNYRRRGRGDSGDTAPYAVEREIEDLQAVIDEIGGQAHVFGASSGGALALRSASAGLSIDRIAAHEVPYLLGDELVAAWQTYLRDLAEALDGGDNVEALRLFMRLAGSSEQDIASAEAAPVWPALIAVAPTLRYDAACVGEGPPPEGQLATVSQPVLLTTGATIDPHTAGLPVDFFGRAADAAVAALPKGRRATIEVAGHVAEPSLLGPVLAEFYLE